MRHQDYPLLLTLAQTTSCTIDPKRHYRIGVPYQLYHCEKREQGTGNGEQEIGKMK